MLLPLLRRPIVPHDRSPEPCPQEAGPAPGEVPGPLVRDPRTSARSSIVTRNGPQVEPCYLLPTFSVGAEVDRAAMNASWGTSTRPTIFIRFLPSFCFSSSLRLRVMSPP